MHWLKHNSTSILIIIMIFIAFLTFEAFQQKFYAENFNNGAIVNLSFWDFLFGGMKRWFIWLGTSLYMIYFAYRNPIRNSSVERRLILKYVGLIICLMIINVCLAAILNIVDTESTWSSFSELTTYYFFHKSPMIFVFLTVTALTVHFFRLKQKVDIQIQALGRLNQSNEKLYNQLKLKQSELSDQSMVIQVKVGRKTHIVPLKDILWIQADDYCVKVHTKSNEAFTLRSSLKKMATFLPEDQFRRIHRTAIVRLEAIGSFQQKDRNTVELVNGQEVPITVANLKELKTAMSFPA